MGYTSRLGRRPNEYASKTAHTHVIKDPTVQALLSECSLPKGVEDVTLPHDHCVPFVADSCNPIRHFVAIDGGYTEVAVRTEFPSATIAFFQLGALFFGAEDLDRLDSLKFIDPADMARLKNIQRFKFALPVRNVSLNSEKSLTHSVRRTVYNFFRQRMEDGTRLIDTLQWFIFHEYETPIASWTLASCPHCSTQGIELARTTISRAHTFVCPECRGELLLTDVLRLHEAVDDELGAGGILGYVTVSIEQLLLVHVIKAILDVKPSLLNEILFVKDGPLAFFGQTANMHKPMRALVKFLFAHHNLYLAGLEKSGPFVEHASQISEIIEPGTILLLDNRYIYKYIIPGKSDSAEPYGQTTYYGNKVIFKANSGAMYVVTVPTDELIANPTEDQLVNLRTLLTNVERLRCDMYDNALIPIALANKLVSLANLPSAKILQRFAVASMKGTGRAQ